jgi:hypothetical protein
MWIGLCASLLRESSVPINQRPQIKVTWIRDNIAHDEARYRIRLFGRDARVFDVRISLTAKAKRSLRRKRRLTNGLDSILCQGQAQLRRFPLTTFPRIKPLFARRKRTFITRPEGSILGKPPSISCREVGGRMLGRSCGPRHDMIPATTTEGCCTHLTRFAMQLRPSLQCVEQALTSVEPRDSKDLAGHP